MNKILFLVLVAGELHATPVGRKTASEEEHTYDYPELSVVPRATDRLALEAEHEKHDVSMLPVALSGLVTGAVGLATWSTVERSAPAVAVGSFWLIGSATLGLWYKPYASAQEEVAHLTQDASVRSVLMRERFAEAALERAASMAQKIRWMSVISNVVASAAMIQKQNNNNDSVISPTAFQAVSVLVALAPLVFRPHAIDVWHDQQEYKKRIYGPVARPWLFFDSKGVAPGVLLTMNF